MTPISDFLAYFYAALFMLGAAIFFWREGSEVLSIMIACGAPFFVWGGANKLSAEEWHRQDALADRERARAIITEWNFGPVPDRDALDALFRILGDEFQKPARTSTPEGE